MPVPLNQDLQLSNVQNQLTGNNSFLVSFAKDCEYQMNGTMGEMNPNVNLS